MAMARREGGCLSSCSPGSWVTKENHHQDRCPCTVVFSKLLGHEDEDMDVDDNSVGDDDCSNDDDDGSDGGKGDVIDDKRFRQKVESITGQTAVEKDYKNWRQLRS